MPTSQEISPHPDILSLSQTENIPENCFTAASEFFPQFPRDFENAMVLIKKFLLCHKNENGFYLFQAGVSPLSIHIHKFFFSPFCFFCFFVFSLKIVISVFMNHGK